MDDRTASDSKQLLGHAGPVYSTSFSPDKNFLLSSSEDGSGKNTQLSLPTEPNYNYRPAVRSKDCNVIHAWWIYFEILKGLILVTSSVESSIDYKM